MKNQSSKPRDTHRKAGKVLNLQQFSEQSTSSQKAQLTLATSGNKTAQERRETVRREKMWNTWLGRRGTCSETPSNHDLTPRATTVHGTGSGKRGRDGGSTDGVERVASRSQTRSTWPTAGDTTPEQQRLVRQKETATRHGHSQRRYVKDVRSTNSLRRTVLNSTATHVNGSTSAHQLARPATPTHTLVHTRSRPYTPSDSHSDSQSDNFVDDYWVTIIHPLSSAAWAQF